MSIKSILCIFFCGFIGVFTILCSLFADAGWETGLIGSIFLVISLIIFFVGSRTKRDWDDLKFPMCGGAILSLLFFLFFKGCVFTDSEPRHYPYHNAITGKGQYEYGGSREQKKDLERIDEYLEEHPNE